MAGTDVVRGREGVKMESHTTRPFSRGQPNRRSVSGGGGDDGEAGLGQNTRSHTLDTIPGLGNHGKSRNRNGRVVNNSNNIGNNNNINRNNTNNNISSSTTNHHAQNRQHYHHKHSRAIANNTKSFSSSPNKSSNNNNNSNSNPSGNSEVLHGDQTPTLDANHSNKNIIRSNKKSSRRTVSLPKAGSRLLGHAHHPTAVSSSADGIHRNNNNSNNNSNAKTLISSATTHSHHLSDSFTVNGNNCNDNNNNVFPPIGTGGQVLTTRLESGGGATNLEGGVKGEQTSLSPRNLAGVANSRMITRGGGGVNAPSSPPEVPLSRLHFLTEPTFESLHPRTPPIHPHHGLVNGSAGGGVMGGVEGGAKVSSVAQANGIASRTNGTSLGGALRVSTLSPDVVCSQQQQPFSPSSSSEKAKGKFEKKVQLSALTEGSTTPQQGLSSPRARMSGAAEGQGGSTVANNINNNNTSKHAARETGSKSRPKKDSITTAKSLPKIAPPEEPFSIRRKIEQFRKWHEEQYMDKLVRFEVDAMGGAASKEGLRGVSYGTPQNGGIGLVDYTKVLEGKIAGGDTADDAVKLGRDVLPKPHLQHFGRGPEQTWNGRSHPVTTIVNGTCGGDMASRTVHDAQHKARPTSAATWKTWRDVNTSDAYKDVKKYIRDNDLMDEEREAWIKSWIADVEEAMLDSGDQAVTAQRTK